MQILHHPFASVTELQATAHFKQEGSSSEELTVGVEILRWRRNNSSSGADKECSSIHRSHLGDLKRTHNLQLSINKRYKIKETDSFVNGTLILWQNKGVKIGKSQTEGMKHLIEWSRGNVMKYKSEEQEEWGSRGGAEVTQVAERVKYFQVSFKCARVYFQLKLYQWGIKRKVGKVCRDGLKENNS